LIGSKKKSKRFSKKRKAPATDLDDFRLGGGEASILPPLRTKKVTIADSQLPKKKKKRVLGRRGKEEKNAEGENTPTPLGGGEKGSAKNRSWRGEVTRGPHSIRCLMKKKKTGLSNRQRNLEPSRFGVQSRERDHAYGLEK